MRLANKVAVVTGAAGGIGEATARLFAREGARVVLADILETRAAAHAADIVASGGHAVGVGCDVRAPDSVRAVINRAVATWGRLDALVNNVGVNFHAAIGDMDEDVFWECLNINLASVYRGCHCAAPVMVRQGGGSIVNISSVQAIMGFRTFSAYATAKAGILGLTRQMAVDYGAAGIRVNAILPGGVDTPMNWAETLGQDRAEVRRRSAARNALPRIGEPLDVAYGALYLASDEAAWVTGHSLVIDGGLSIAGSRQDE
ncbi:MAG: SDR family oxidoreductase [Actinobacteria bacterium]|nr:SDR family oxidoreductase [Actinomycetota bacterium]